MQIVLQKSETGVPKRAIPYLRLQRSRKYGMAPSRMAQPQLKLRSATACRRHADPFFRARAASPSMGQMTHAGSLGGFIGGLECFNSSRHNLVRLAFLNGRRVKDS